MIRNLLYNCFASKWSEEWRLNIAYLCKYSHVFNGRKIILIKTGENIHDPDIVKAEFNLLGNNVEFICVPNDPELGEVVGFIDALALLESRNKEEITFYAHTKGTKYKDANARHMIAVRQWRNRMYDECLWNVNLIEELLKRYACCGCFLQRQAAVPFANNVTWHFAGTFWWINHEKLFSSNNWRDISQSFYGVEAYLGDVFPVEEAYCLYEGSPKHNLYSTLGVFHCTRCGHEFEAIIKLYDNPVKVCTKCFKRKAEFLYGPDATGDFPIYTPMRPQDKLVELKKLCDEIVLPNFEIVELGCYYGESTIEFAKHASKVFAIDSWEEKYFQHPEHKRDFKDETMANVEALFDRFTSIFSNVYKIKKTHEEAATDFRDNSLDLVYCDTTHSEEDTVNAIDIWTPKVKSNGWMSGHDYTNQFPGAIKAVNERKSKEFKLWGDGNWAYRV